MKNPRPKIVQIIICFFFLVPFKGNTFRPSKLFDIIFVVRFLPCIKIDPGFGDHAVVRRKFLPCEHSIEIREQETNSGGQIWTTRWMRKQFQAQFMDFWTYQLTYYVKHEQKAEFCMFYNSINALFLFKATWNLI